MLANRRLLGNVSGSTNDDLKTDGRKAISNALDSGDPMLNRTLAHYEIKAKLGQGGMGEVYRARDQKLGRDVALKVLPQELGGDPERRKRFEREARAVAALKHPNIITLHSIEEADGVHFITMEYVEGDTLSAEIVEDGLPLDRFFDLAVPLADALASAHAKGIVHRDLKPANIMRDADGRLKILDFGLAKLFETDMQADETVAAGRDSVTGEGRIVGTVAYMSPEQAEGRTVDARSDVFSLGVVLYEVATGRRPFQGGTNISTLSAILKDEPPAVTELRPILPRHLGRIIARCLAKDPERRYQSALDVRNELENLRAEITSGALEVPAAARQHASVTAADPRRRSGWRRGAGIVLGSTIVVAVLLVAYAWRRSDDGPVAPTAIRSLAVLPFSNLSQDASDDYFSDGMTDVLTTELARLSALKVIARNSAARFKDTSRPPAEIARELGVEALVSGSVLRDGDRVRISAQLAEAENDRVVWAESYDRAARDVLSLQGEVARAVAGAIALQLSPDEESRLSGARAVDPRALDEYLQGRYLWARRTEPAVRQSLAHFRAAIDLAPDFAPAHAGVADAHIVAAGYNWMEPRQAAPIAFAAIETALALDPLAGEPHASRGDLAFHVEHDFELAARELDRAIELSPGYATAYYWRAAYLLAFAQEMTGRVDEAERGYRRVLEFSPGYSIAWKALVRLDLAKGKTTEALASAQRAVEENPSPSNLATLGVALALAGQSSEARSILTRLHDLARERWVSPYVLARVEAALGDRAAALDHLRAAIEARDFQSPNLKVRVDIEFREFVGDSRFQQLIDGIGRRD
jgi:non-specific serine/threonine protein kinase